MHTSVSIKCNTNVVTETINTALNNKRTKPFHHILFTCKSVDVTHLIKWYASLTSVLGYPRPALPSAGSLSIFETIMASNGTPKLPSTRQPCWLPYSTGVSCGSCIADTSQSCPRRIAYVKWQDHILNTGPTDLQHIWHWSLSDISATSLDRTHNLYEREHAAEAGLLQSAWTWHTLPWWEAGRRDIRIYWIQSECVQYRSEETWDISRWQIIVACNVQSFGATLPVKTSQRLEEAIPT